MREPPLDPPEPSYAILVQERDELAEKVERLESELYDATEKAEGLREENDGIHRLIAAFADMYAELAKGETDEAIEHQFGLGRDTNDE